MSATSRAKEQKDETIGSLETKCVKCRNSCKCLSFTDTSAYFTEVPRFRTRMQHIHRRQTCSHVSPRSEDTLYIGVVCDRECLCRRFTSARLLLGSSNNSARLNSAIAGDLIEFTRYKEEFKAAYVPQHMLLYRFVLLIVSEIRKRFSDDAKLSSASRAYLHNKWHYDTEYNCGVDLQSPVSLREIIATVDVVSAKHLIVRVSICNASFEHSPCRFACTVSTVARTTCAFTRITFVWRIRTRMRRLSFSFARVCKVLHGIVWLRWSMRCAMRFCSSALSTSERRVRYRKW